MVLEAIRFKGETNSGQTLTPASLDILDQLLLPHETTFIPISTCQDAHNAIKKMQVRGAPAIAIVAALALATELSHETQNGALTNSAQEQQDLIGSRLDYLKTSRPTAVNLSDAIGKLKKVVERAASGSDASSESVVAAYVKAAEKMLEDDVADNKAIGEHGARWIEKQTEAGVRRTTDPKQALQVLTHCNTGSLATAGYGTALGVIRSLRANDMLTHAFCSETRPYNQGSRLTAYELVHDKIPATLVTDSMAASLLQREGKDVAAIVVGADRVAANGDTANKIGTYSLAVLARHHGVKFLVAAPRTTIDLATSSGKQIVIEERASDEVTRIKGPCIDVNGKIIVGEDPATINIAATGIDVWNPAFDVTPASLIDGIVTECGVVEKVDGRFDFTHIFEE